jgi:hypothetical protein
MPIRVFFLEKRSILPVIFLLRWDWDGCKQSEKKMGEHEGGGES